MKDEAFQNKKKMTKFYFTYFFCYFVIHERNVIHYFVQYKYNI